VSEAGDGQGYGLYRRAGSGVRGAGPRSALRRARLGFLVVATAGCASAPPPAAPPSEAVRGARAEGAFEYDVVIRGGRVLDGAGSPWIAADVAIRDGRIARVGHVEGRGRAEIDARGRYVSPGWIDMMDQSGSVLLQNGLAENKLRMGVTTAIGGEGGTPAAARGVADYFRRLEDQGISINFGSYFSASQARVAVLGTEDRAPTAPELDRMRAVMDTAMRGGALGMTTALIYPPSSYADTDELVELARVAASYGGIYASHIRGEGAEVVEAVNEAIEIGERGGLPVEIFHLKVAYQPGWGVLMDSVGRNVDRARARGVDVAADVYPYTAGGTGLEATVPSWAHAGGRDSLRARLERPEVRERLKRELDTGSPGWWNIVEASGGWENVVLVNARNESNARFEGTNLAEIAAELGVEPADAAWDLVLEGEGRVMAIYHMMSEPDVETALRFPWTSIGSDAGAALEAGSQDGLGLPHPRSYGTFPRVIRRYVLDRGVLTLEEAIRKMTSWPAARMRLEGRGLLRAGFKADVVVFDLDRIDDRATYDEPTLFPTGIDWVLVNGVVVIEEGHHTGARPGEVLYGPGRAAAPEAAPGRPPRYDLVIEGGRVVDGTGAAWFLGDVAVSGDRIVKVAPAGMLADAAAVERLDARGMVVAPGFIDIQSHSRGPLLRGDGRIVSKVTQGITTEIMGELWSNAPANEFTLQGGVDNIGSPELQALSRSFIGPGGFDRWLGPWSSNGPSTNFGSFVGGSTIRVYGMGQQMGPAGPAELDSMQKAVRWAMEERRLRCRHRADLSARQLRRHGRADRGRRRRWRPTAASTSRTCARRRTRCSRRSTRRSDRRPGGVPVEIYHLKAAGTRNWHKAPLAIAKIDSARAAGLDVQANMYPVHGRRDRSERLLPPWASEDGRLYEQPRRPGRRVQPSRPRSSGPETKDWENLCELSTPEGVMVLGFDRPENAVGRHAPVGDRRGHGQGLDRHGVRSACFPSASASARSTS
jgi:N-acyl-D-amino-acid deacylase